MLQDLLYIPLILLIKKTSKKNALIIMKKNLYLFFSLLCSISFLLNEASAQKSDIAAIRKMLNQQIVDWNRGDIEAYMKGYWNSDSLLFVGKNGIRNGYKATLQSYKKGYPDTAAMGKLDFELLQVKRLSPIYFSVLGKWHLQRTIGDLNGYFTLLLKKIKGRWVIVSDHSS